jgi:hypothetical protein
MTVSASSSVSAADGAERRKNDGLVAVWGGGREGGVVFNDVVNSQERQWQMNEMWVRDIRGIVGPTDGWEPKFVVEIWHLFFKLWRPGALS